MAAKTNNGICVTRDAIEAYETKRVHAHISISTNEQFPYFLRKLAWGMSRRR